MCLLILLRLCAVTAAGSGTAHSETQVRGAGSWQDFAEAVGRVRRPGWIHTQTVVSGFVPPTPGGTLVRVTVSPVSPDGSVSFPVSMFSFLLSVALAPCLLPDF